MSERRSGRAKSPKTEKSDSKSDSPTVFAKRRWSVEVGSVRIRSDSLFQSSDPQFTSMAIHESTSKHHTHQMISATWLAVRMALKAMWLGH